MVLSKKISSDSCDCGKSKNLSYSTNDSWICKAGLLMTVVATLRTPHQTGDALCRSSSKIKLFF